MINRVHVIEISILFLLNFNDLKLKSEKLKEIS
jgi:hypothetical protein